MLSNLLSSFPTKTINISLTNKDGFEKARVVVKYFYYISIFWLLDALSSLVLSNIRLESYSPDLWPLLWIKVVPNPELAAFIFFTLVILCGLLFYWHWFGRVVIFLGLLEYVALLFSLPKGGGAEWYHWLNTAFIFIFMPNVIHKKNPSKDKRLKFLLFFWGAQALFLLTYTFAGINKLLVQLDNPSKPNLFDLHIFSDTIAHHITINPNATIAGELVAQSVFLSYSMYLAALFLQIFSFWIAFEPSFHRIWGLLLLLFHVGTAFTLDILFSRSVILAILLLWDSPFLVKRSLLSTKLGTNSRRMVCNMGARAIRLIRKLLIVQQ